jgi:hypothetical protein
VSLLNSCLVFIGGRPFLSLAIDEVSYSINYIVTIYSLVFSSINLVVELEWFSASIKDFRKRTRTSGF